MPCEGTDSSVQPSYYRIHICSRVVPDFAAAAHPLLDGSGYAVINDIDDTPDGTTTVEQSRGAAENFNGIGEHSLDRNRMIGTQIRRIGTAGAVLQYGDT